MTRTWSEDNASPCPPVGCRETAAAGDGRASSRTKDADGCRRLPRSASRSGRSSLDLDRRVASRHHPTISSVLPTGTIDKNISRFMLLIYWQQHIKLTTNFY